MIRRVAPADEPVFLRLLDADPLWGGRIKTAYECHKSTPGVCGFYLADSTGALMVQGGGALLCGEADGAELGAFLSFSGVEVFKGGSAAPKGFLGRSRMQMCHSGAGGEVPPLPRGVTLDEVPSLWKLAHAGVLEGVRPEDYYADACLRRNRGLADILACRLEGRCVATAGVYSLRAGSAYITAVAVSPACRGMGLARAMVGHLARKYAGRTVWLICEEALRPLYEKAGFYVDRVFTEYFQSKE